MRKSIITFILLCFTSTGFAQQSAEATNFINKMEALDKEIALLREAKNYKKAEQICRNAIDVYNALSEEGQAIYKSSKAYIYYDLACYQALQGKKKEAMKSLIVSHNCGWSDYNNLSKDTDLDNIRTNKEFQHLLAQIREESDYKYILQKANGYDREERAPVCHNESLNVSIPQFTYMNPNDSNLVRIREYFNLDSIAGHGNEISKIKNLLCWVHNTIRHDGSSYNPTEKNAIAMVELCKKENRGVNCRMLAQILNECYLAMGFKSRYVTCMPKTYINDCHVINVVYSNTLDKWIWVDPTFNAYVTDENGNLLSIAEVRERLRKDKPLMLNEDANWNNQSKQTKEYYLDTYMAKNLYYVICPLRSEYNAETEQEGKKGPVFISLIPQGFDSQGKYRAPDYETNNDRYFWQSPYQE